MKVKVLILLAAFALVLMSVVPAIAAPKISVNNQELTFETAPVIEQGRMLVPLRAFSEALGGIATWDNSANTVIVTRDNLEVKFGVDQTIAYKNNFPVEMDVPAKIINGRIWVPLRFVSETLGAEVAWDQDARTVNVKTENIPARLYVLGSDVSFEPFEFYDPNGQMTGFDIDLINAVCKEANIEFKIEDIELPDIFHALNTAQIDGAISCITATEMRQQIYEFSVPYFLYGQSVAVPSDNKTINGLDDLKNKKVGVQIGTAGHREAMEIPDAVVTEYNSVNEALQSLKNGSLDAVITDFHATAYYLNKGNHNIKIIGDTFANQPIAIAFTKDNAGLRDLVNDTLAKLKENGEYARIYKKWFGVEPPHYLPGNEVK